jgi:antitoxin component of RelBE/YafQ-DinJ toxin-antitoxin module
MPRSRLTTAETAAIKARLLAGESVAAVARSMGRSRQALSRIKGSLDRKEVRRLSVKLNIRITEDEHASFQTVAEASGLTVSEAVRHLVRQAISDRLAIQADELDAIAAARRELSAVGNNLNQIARLGAVGRLTWNARDAALVRKLGARVDDLVEEVVHLLSALRAKQGLRDQASSFVPAADASAEAPK